jgi:hypothetical protein
MSVRALEANFFVRPKTHTRTMKWKYRLGWLALLLLLTMLWLLYRQTGTDAPKHGQLNLSYNLCLKADAGYQPLENDALARINYAQNYWADSTGQYFSKTLLSPSGDTLLVSVFNQASLRKAEEALRAAGFENLQQKRLDHSSFSALIALARAPDGTFFLRRLIADAQFQVVAMADQASRDSTALSRLFQTDHFVQSLEKCL